MEGNSSDRGSNIFATLFFFFFVSVLRCIHLSIYTCNIQLEECKVSASGNLKEHKMT